MMNLSIFWKLIILCSLTSCAKSVSEDAGCFIEFQSDTYKNKPFYLASHFGKYQTLLDSVTADSKGKLIFKNKKKYVSGIYMLLNDSKEIEFEFLMDAAQQFKIEPNSKNPSKTKIYNSQENIDFKDFTVFLKTKRSEIELLQKSIKTTSSPKEKLDFADKIKSVENEIEKYKQNYRLLHTNTLALLFKLTQPLKDFSSLKNQKLATKKDSLLFLKNNYFKGIDFNDSRLLRNPFFEQKLSTYFNVFVPKTVDSITEEITRILDEANTLNSDTFKYMSLYFIDLYINPKQMGHDRVFLNLYETYFKNQTYEWLPLTQKELFKLKARLLKNNQIGSKAKELFMNSIDNTPLYLYDLNADYIVLVFWDPTCGHCQTEIPKINRLHKNDWKNINHSIYAVNINTEVKLEWEKFISKHDLNTWNHVSPAKVVRGNYSQKDVDYQTHYNIEQTPVFYLLDKDKIIIGKDIDPQEYSKLMKS
ncbi:redoxin domain-containing protein [Polaribacter sp.]|uniref:redoxin domain-containing protein n=1 Tax=Polaribacter sp. TaxID=1920175 RepID=UPI003F6A1A21